MEFGNSIIAQVARTEPEHKTYSTTHIDKKAASNGSVKNKKKKNSTNTRTFQSLLCCMRPRKPSSQARKTQDDQISTTPSLSLGTTQQQDTDGGGGNNPTIASSDDGTNGELKYLLPPKPAEHARKKCAVIDLDETLVHSSFKPISNADFIVPVEIDGTTHEVYVLKRPHVDTYLERMGEMYECVLFTASLAKYADPVADLLDKSGVFSWRLFRESCVFHHGNYVKDLNLIGRDLNKMIIIDNSPASYSFHPNNAVPVLSWFDDPSDTELLDILPFLEAIAESDDVYSVLRNHGFTQHAVRNTDFLRQQQHMQQHIHQQQQQVITSVEEGQER